MVINWGLNGDDARATCKRRPMQSRRRREEDALLVDRFISRSLIGESVRDHQFCICEKVSFVFLLRNI